jgi:glycosyltransferase involved in cell wall biosynthesis
MRRVLMVCPFFVPSAGVATKRPLRFVRNLRSFGWEPIVLTVEGSAGEGTDEGQERLLPEDLIVKRSYAGPSWELWRRLEVYKASVAGLGGQVKATSPQQVKRMKALTDLTFLLTPVDRFLPYAYGASREIVRLCDEQQIDLVYVTASPFSAMLAGIWAKQKTGLPLLFDMRDPWTLSPLSFVKKPAILQAVEHRLERLCLTRAERVIFNTARCADAYRALYPSMQQKFFHMHNGFDQTQFLPAPTAPIIEETIVHFGNFFHQRSVGSVLRAAQRFPGVRLVVYGRFRDEDLALASSLGMAERMEQRKPVTYEQSMQELSKAGVLLLLQPETTDLQIPAKLFDYLCAKRPILALANNPEISKILQETNTGIAVSNSSEDEIGSALEKLLHAPTIAAQQLESFDATYQTKALAEHFNALIR